MSLIISKNIATTVAAAAVKSAPKAIVVTVGQRAISSRAPAEGVSVITGATGGVALDQIKEQLGRGRMVVGITSNEGAVKQYLEENADPFDPGLLKFVNRRNGLQEQE